MAFTCNLTDSQRKNTQLPLADVLRQSRYTAVWPGTRTSTTPKRLSQIRPSGRDAVMKETKRFVGTDVAKAQLDVAIGPNGESCLGLRGYGRVPGRARLGFIRGLGAELPGRFMCTPAIRTRL